MSIANIEVTQDELVALTERAGASAIYFREQYPSTMKSLVNAVIAHTLNKVATNGVCWRDPENDPPEVGVVVRVKVKFDLNAIDNTNGKEPQVTIGYIHAESSIGYEWAFAGLNGEGEFVEATVYEIIGWLPMHTA